MKPLFRLLSLCAGILFFSTSLYAQNVTIKAVLKDASSGEPVSFATVSLTRENASRADKYSLSSEDGAVSIGAVRPGKYQFKAELMGYRPFTLDVAPVSGDLDLGELKMTPETEILDAATVTAVGNPIIVKKDTVEYNANAYKTTDNDVLEDLLKKLPGVEVSENGSITWNGETIKKITIDGKTFFLDDPQLASKNIPAKAINKLKVIEKKSEQAQFTGIDDGEEEMVIDLSLKKGMMKGLFGNLMAGGGHDIPSKSNTMSDWRFQGAGFLGRFKDKSQISVILNANNTNNRAFNDLAGSMMQGLRGGGGGYGQGQGGWGRSNGITTSYMAGVNGAWDLLDDKMNLGGNYLFNRTEKDVLESSLKTTYLESGDMLYQSDGNSNTVSNGHRFGVRLEHKFSENTSILFEPQVNFGDGYYSQGSNADTYRGNTDSRVNSSRTLNMGRNRNVSTSGWFLLRQRLGAPGRTLTAFARYSFSDNRMFDGLNMSNTCTYGDEGDDIVRIRQRFTNNAQSTSVGGRVTYTQPLSGNFYLEANYGYNWAQSSSDKSTFDFGGGKEVQNFNYSNKILNRSSNHEIGANALFQTEKFRAQLGFAALPTTTYNRTTRYNSETDAFEPMEYDPGTRWFWSPQAMLWWEMGDNSNARLFYRGRAGQPSTSQLMPVPDNTNPLSVSFGNPTLNPYFTHSIRGGVRYNNKKNFSSFNLRLNASVVQDPVVNASWYDEGGAQYSMPFNGPLSASAGINGFLNLPVAKSGFTIENTLRANWSMNTSYIGENIDMTLYRKDGYYAFMEQFIKDFADRDYYEAHITRNNIHNLNAFERLTLTWRNNALEISASGRTRVNHSWYTVSRAGSDATTWNNQVRATVNWTWDLAGLAFKSQFSYNWYNGYTTPQDSEYILDAEIQKLLFKKQFTLALKGYDVLGQAKNLDVTDNANYHTESVNNTLGRYVVLSLTWRFGSFSGRQGGMPGGYGGRRPPRF
ncbi:MAG: TonB-dependent receptor [Bacteroidales bacterium]|nr:TonB-dependent receptor [Bacteroidales bacterium]